jgi:hypothetical protein
LTRQAFPDGVALAYTLLGIEPPEVPYVVSAFRETNSANERDLDSSVLWKAGSTLRSAFKAQVLHSREYHLEAIAFTDEADELHLSTDFIHRHVRMVDYYLPVVVLRSRLWVVKNKTIEEVPSFRFVQLDHLGDISWWFDVVQFDYFEEYAATVTKHYSGRLRKLRATLLRI